MRNWICVINKENFKVVLEKRVWGVTERHKNLFQKIQPGDICAFYIIGEWQGADKRDSCIGGLFTVISKPYFDTSDIFPSKRTDDERYPYRIELKSMQDNELNIPFKPLVQHLSFIIKKHNYGSYMVGRPLREITVEDLNIIKEALKEGNKLK